MSRGVMVAEMRLGGVGRGRREMNAIMPARVKAQVVKKPKVVWRRLREECIVVACYCKCGWERYWFGFGSLVRNDLGGIWKLCSYVMLYEEESVRVNCRCRRLVRVLCAALSWMYAATFIIRHAKSRTRSHVNN